MGDQLEQFYSLCLQGDIKSAMTYLRSTQPKTEEIHDLETRFYHRFFAPDGQEEIPVQDEFIRSVIYGYHDYFRSVLTDQKTVEAAEIELTSTIAQILQTPSSTPIVSMEEMLASEFRERGYYFLGGVTPPYRGPYIWEKENILSFDVELPFSKQTVTVHMMSDFLLESWIGFATCENKHVGGWAKGDELFCNATRYKDLQGAAFQVSYLKHEAQHLSDFLHFPDLPPAQLEYRAKLVELIYAEDHTVLNKFILEAKNDSRFPHSFASYQILNNLSHLVFRQEMERNAESWAEKEYGVISAAALSLYENSTNELKMTSGK